MRLLLMPGLKSMLVAGIEMKPLQHVLTVSFERESWLHVFTHIILLLHSHPLRRIWWDATLVLCDYPVWLWLTVPGLICTEYYFAVVYNLIMLNTVGIIGLYTLCYTLLYTLVKHEWYGKFVLSMISLNLFVSRVKGLNIHLQSL